MNPLDALNPNITDERLAESYGDSFMGLVEEGYPISAVRHDDKVWAHQWFTDLMLLIKECECEDKVFCDCLSDWDRIPTIVCDLLVGNKRLREEVKMLWQYVDTEQMYNDGLLTVEGEMIE